MECLVGSRLVIPIVLLSIYYWLQVCIWLVAGDLCVFIDVLIATKQDSDQIDELVEDDVSIGVNLV